MFIFLLFVKLVCGNLFFRGSSGGSVGYSGDLVNVGFYCLSKSRYIEVISSSSFRFVNVNPNIVFSRKSGQIALLGDTAIFDQLGTFERSQGLDLKEVDRPNGRILRFNCSDVPMNIRHARKYLDLLQSHSFCQNQKIVSFSSAKYNWDDFKFEVMKGGIASTMKFEIGTRKFQIEDVPSDATQIFTISLVGHSDRKDNFCEQKVLSNGIYSLAENRLLRVDDSGVYEIHKHGNFFSVTKRSQKIDKKTAHVKIPGISEEFIRTSNSWKLKNSPTSDQTIDNKELLANFDRIKPVVDLKGRRCKDSKIYEFLGDGTLQVDGRKQMILFPFENSSNIKRSAIRLKLDGTEIPIDLPSVSIEQIFDDCHHVGLPVGNYKFSRSNLEYFLEVYKTHVVVIKIENGFFTMKQTNQRVITGGGVSIDSMVFKKGKNGWSNERGEIVRVDANKTAFPANIEHVRKFSNFKGKRCAWNKEYEFTGDGTVRVGKETREIISFQKVDVLSHESFDMKVRIGSSVTWVIKNVPRDASKITNVFPGSYFSQDQGSACKRRIFPEMFYRTPSKSISVYVVTPQFIYLSLKNASGIFHLQTRTLSSQKNKELFNVSSIGTVNVKSDGWYYQEEGLEAWNPDKPESRLWKFGMEILQFKWSICKDGKVYEFLGDGNANTEGTKKPVREIKLDPKLKKLKIIVDENHINFDKIDMNSALKVASLFKPFPVTNFCMKKKLPEGLHKMNEIYLDVTKDAVYLYTKSSDSYYSMKKATQTLTEKGVSIDGIDIQFINSNWSNVNKLSVPYKPFEAFLENAKKIYSLSKKLCLNKQIYEFLGDGRVRVGSQMHLINFRSDSEKIIVKIGDQEISLDAKAKEIVPLFLKHFTDKSGNACFLKEINSGKYSVSNFKFEIVGSSVYIYTKFPDHSTILKTTQTVTEEGVLFYGFGKLVQDGVNWKLSNAPLKVISELPRNYEVMKGFIETNGTYCKGETMFLGDGRVNVLDKVFAIQFHADANGNIKLKTKDGQVLGEVSPTGKLDLSILGREDCKIIKPGYYCNGKNQFIITEDIGWRVSSKWEPDSRKDSYLIEPFSPIYTDSGKISISLNSFSKQFPGLTNTEYFKNFSRIFQAVTVGDRQENHFVGTTS